MPNTNISRRRTVQRPPLRQKNDLSYQKKSVHNKSCNNVNKRRGEKKRSKEEERVYREKKRALKREYMGMVRFQNKYAPTKTYRLCNRVPIQHSDGVKEVTIVKVQGKDARFGNLMSCRGFWCPRCSQYHREETRTKARIGIQKALKAGYHAKMLTLTVPRDYGNDDFKLKFDSMNKTFRGLNQRLRTKCKRENVDLYYLRGLDVTVDTTRYDPLHLHIHCLIITNRKIEGLKDWIWKTYRRLQSKMGIKVHRKGFDLSDVETNKEISDYIVKTLGTIEYELTSTNKNGRSKTSKGWFKWLKEIYESPTEQDIGIYKAFLEASKGRQTFGFSTNWNNLVSLVPDYASDCANDTTDSELSGDNDEKERENKKILESLKINDELNIDSVNTEQKFTQPPARYNQASLIQALEELGIGRPSTYVTIINKIMESNYVDPDKSNFQPTALAKVVYETLINHFKNDLVDFDFTARLEEDLDKIANGEKEYMDCVEKTYKPFKNNLDDKIKTVDISEQRELKDLGVHPETNRPVTVRLTRYGPTIQMGTKDDEEKPKWAALTPEQKKNIDAITLDDAIRLFKLPEKIGEFEGEDILINIGPFGPYVKCGKTNVSMKEIDIFSLSEQEAISRIEEKREIDANREIKIFESSGIKVLNGMYGPYITDGKKNVRVPKDIEPQSLNENTCIEMIKNAPKRRARRTRAKR